ncbi:ABC transporter permease [Kitasatospora sp. NBC_00240]|uniref:ABC transporter permease n=1 Tax=Kitasatospora sp. NBC_00240 TaxID=2903567 RepID=UPI00224F7288|nr:ABC transporter permease [Kitasatospora sp. NBC_00240]MCX5215519.1 ABC transporter permease [Kitasatospora sp. NBC_00240]
MNHPGEAQRSASGPTRPSRVRRPEIVRDHGILLSLLVLVLWLSMSTDAFLTSTNLVNLLDQAAVPGLLACAATLCLLCGLFDLSMSAVLALSAVTSVLVTGQFGILWGACAGILTGALCGLVNGAVVIRIGVHSFIGTLALGFVYRGLALILTAGAIVYPQARQLPRFQLLARPDLPAGVTPASVLFLLVAAALWLLLAGTTFGRRVYAVGGNAEAARLSGIRVGAVRVAVLVLSSVCAALAGLVLASRGGSAQADMGSLLELSAIAAAVVGGTSVLGGQGALWRGLVGIAILTLIGNGFNLLGFDTTYQQVLEGLLILGAVSVDQTLRRRD